MLLALIRLYISLAWDLGACSESRAQFKADANALPLLCYTVNKADMHLNNSRVDTLLPSRPTLLPSSSSTVRTTPLPLNSTSSSPSTTATPCRTTTEEEEEELEICRLSLPR